MQLEKKMLVYAEQNLNVLLVGKHGVGKSLRVKAIAEKMGMRFKYYSASTLDPFADLVGIPVPDRENKSIDFYRPDDLLNAEFVFFDELNRAHPRVLNTVMEIIQFKSINGKPLKNLKMIWGAINPPGGDYQVEDLDPALVDRFHVYMNVVPEINLSYMKTVMNEGTAKALKGWWDDDLSQEQQDLITPRRIEYIGNLISNDIPFRDALPLGKIFPVPNLMKRLKNDARELKIDIDSILKDPSLYLEAIKKNKSMSIEIAKYARKFSNSQVFVCRDIIEEMPKELVIKIANNKWQMLRRDLKNIFVTNKVDLKKYPKISEAFGFENC